MLVVLEPPGIIIDDIFNPGDLLFQMHELVGLFLILGQSEFALGMIDNELKFLVDGILIKGNGHTSQTLAGGHTPIKVGPVVPDDGHFVIFLEP